MKPEQFDKLDKTQFGGLDAEGNPVLSMMSDPSGSGGPGTSGDYFVSVVPKGANGLRWAAMKADTGAEGDASASVATKAWRAFRAFLAAEGKAPGTGAAAVAEASKSDTPVTFEAALYPRKLMNAMWDGQDALNTAIRGILEDDTVTDKLGAISSACDGFKAFVMDAARPVVAAKSEDLAIIKTEVATIGDRTIADPLAAKIGRSISGVNAATIRACKDKVAEAAAALDALLSDNGHGDQPDAAAKSATSPQENAMKLAVALKLATLSVKADQPTLTGDALAAAVAEKAEKLMALKMTGDVGEPADDLGRLLAESGLAQGAGGSPNLPDALLSAIMKLPAMKSLTDRVAQLEAALNGTPATKGDDGKEIAAQPGLRMIAEKALEVSIGVAKKVRIPTAPAGGPTEPAPAAKKDDDGDDALFEDSPFAVLPR